MTVDQTFVLTGLHYKTDEPISVKIRDGMIQAIERIQETHLKSNRTIAPGLIDLQVTDLLEWILIWVLILYTTI